MAKRNSKEPVQENPVRRTNRAIKFRTDLRYNAKKTPNAVTDISHLPSEILCMIFSHFTAKELFYNIRPVCRRWREVAMCPVLWKKIEIGKEIPSETLQSWLKRATLLKHFAAKDRNDIDGILDLMSRYNKRLESIKIHNCWGSEKNGSIKSVPLCNLVSRCHRLDNFYFNQTRFSSCKFFKLISCDKRAGKVMKRCNYVGPMNAKQLKALFSALKSNEVHDSATIGNVNLNHKFKLKEVVRYIEELEANSAYVNDVWENLNYGENNLDNLIPMQVDV